MDEVYRCMITNLPPSDQGDQLWVFYMRVYETLWKLPRGSLAGNVITREMDIDAGIAARIIRVFSQRWILGIKKLAYVFFKYFPLPDQTKKKSMPNFDIELIGEIDPNDLANSIYGLTQISEDEAKASGDSELSVYTFSENDFNPQEKPTNSASLGQRRTPAEFGALMADLGIKIPPHKLAIQYYSELASPYLIPFPTNDSPSMDKIMEGSEMWEFGEDFDTLDWNLTLLESPVVVPSITTRKRVYGEEKGNEVQPSPLYLDLYIDCSGSMPNPYYQISYLTLAGVIMALSALRAGAKVQATLWSDYGKFKSTHEFTDDREKLLEIVTGFISGGTGFPLNILRDTYSNYLEDSPPAHVMVISDEGVDTMMDHDEFKTPGEKIVKMMFEKARGGGTLVLNLYGDNLNDKLIRLQKLGFDLQKVRSWPELIIFARNFSEKTYGSKKHKKFLNV
jgi:hypothetical protein